MDCSTPGLPSITNSPSLHKLMSIEPVMPSNHLILCHPLLLQPSIVPSIKVFSNESVLLIKWPNYWSSNFSTSPSNEYSRLLSFRIDCLELFATSWTAARQASLSFTISLSLCKLTSTESVMPIQPSHPLLSPSPPALNLSQLQGLFQWVSFSHQVAKVLELHSIKTFIECLLDASHWTSWWVKLKWLGNHAWSFPPKETRVNKLWQSNVIHTYM